MTRARGHQLIIGDTLRVGGSGLKYVTGIEGYDPIVKVVPEDRNCCWQYVVSFFDVTSSSFHYQCC
jgi:hypothetical protein